MFYKRDIVWKLYERGASILNLLVILISDGHLEFPLKMSPHRGVQK
jgi:hypothetical protein